MGQRSQVQPMEAAVPQHLVQEVVLDRQVVLAVERQVHRSQQAQELALVEHQQELVLVERRQELAFEQAESVKVHTN